MSIASEVLPLPLGPQKTVIFSRGTSTSTCCKLCWAAPRITISFVDAPLSPLPPAGVIRELPAPAGTERRRCPPSFSARADVFAVAKSLRTRLPFAKPGRTVRSDSPVYDSAQAATSSGVPSTTISPPPDPPSGPRSIIQSAVLSTSRLCSTTITVLPASTNPCSTSSSLWMSAKCRPVVGSSKQIERAAGRPLAQLAGQLDPLGLAAGERRRRLAELDVIETDVVQRLQQIGDRRNVLEVLERLLHVHFQHVGDAGSLCSGLRASRA